MKKVISISFLIIFLLANTELNEVVRLPYLFEHYLLHKQDEKIHSFLTFLYIHYASGQEHEHLENEHEKLPLKTKDCIKLNLTVVLFSLQSYSFVSEDFHHLKKSIRFKKIFLSNLNKVSIWQPPQIS